MKKHNILLMLLGLLIFNTKAQQTNIDFIEYDLDNGLHVILHEDKSTPIVAVTVLYHVGSKNEDPNRTGFAHFFEHLLFEGSENIERGQYDKLVTGAGGALNANTSFDRTFYFEVLPSNQLELGLYLESERMLHAKIDSVGVETQREVVKEEKRQSYDNQPYGSILLNVLDKAYDEHPYQWAPIGSMDHLNQATLEEFMEFYRTFYVPNNATLSLAGDIDIETTKKLVEKYFGDIPKGKKEIPRPDIVEPKKTKEVRDVVFDNIQLPAAIQAYHMPAQGTDDYYALDVLTNLLSNGESSRLNKALIDDQQKALFVGAIPLAAEDPGLFITFGIANGGIEVADLENSIDEELERVKSELITEREFQKVQNQIENDFISSNGRVAGIAESLANYHVYFGDANLINTEIDKYRKVTREDIKRVANTYLTKENRVVLHYLPKSAQKQPEDATINKEGN